MVVGSLAWRICLALEVPRTQEADTRGCIFACKIDGEARRRGVPTLSMSDTMNVRHQRSTG